jgi:hypothetical protein
MAGQEKLRSRTVHEAVKALHVLGHQKLFHLQWIKAHNSVGNDLADTMAKRGARTPTYQPSPILPMALKQHKPCRQTKLFFPAPDCFRLHEILCFTRKQTRTLIRAICGHNFMQYHRHNVHKWVDPECCLCQQADEESNHVIRECTAIVALRQQYFGEDYLDAGWAWEPAQLLDFLQDLEIAILETDPEE